MDRIPDRARSPVKVSIITVAYNAKATIADTLASVRAQTHHDYEHIVIDGASSDSTLGIVTEHSNPRTILISEPNQGIYDAMNKGPRLATGQLIGFLNADDFYVRTDALSLLANAAAEDRQAAAVGGGVALIRRGDVRRMRRYYPSSGFRPWMLRFGHMPPHPGFYVRREAAGRVGAFDHRVRTGADFEWMVRFFHVHKLKLRPIPQTIVGFRLGGNSSNGFESLRNINREALASRRRWGLASNTVAVWSKYVVKSRQLFERPGDFPLSAPIGWSPE
jgi:glycosyltransferase involved in cell wall biosynthesis